MWSAVTRFTPPPLATPPRSRRRLAGVSGPDGAQITGSRRFGRTKRVASPPSHHAIGHHRRSGFRPPPPAVAPANDHAGGRRRAGGVDGSRGSSGCRRSGVLRRPRIHRCPDGPSVARCISVRTRCVRVRPEHAAGRSRPTVDADRGPAGSRQFGTGRYALLFKPGTYGIAGQAAAFQVGYYTEVAGLGPARATSSSTARSTSTTSASPARQLHRAGQLLALAVQPDHQRRRRRGMPAATPSSGPSRRPRRCAGSTSTATPR